ncbi:hypothetical protein BDZ94DRAFT_1372691 [Collybia nuda]|uniref:HAT C-terminal dimerisation domain-containing protein n=1 Tax=Collybia nuda TaxID=64659 RepID=A0A9P5Y0W5_9AGAR|nr:hypothetical protein BDZ94DRAFT_1372691 [Collybia nuda]
MEKELSHLQGLGLIPVGFSGDAGGDERKARCLALKKYPALLIADCWAHQVPLMLANYKKANPVVSKVMDESSEVAKWFNNHSYALGELGKEQADMYNGKVLALITPVVTWWTAYYCSMDQNLQIWKALRVTPIKHHDAIMETRVFKTSAEGSGLMSEVYDYAAREKAYSEARWPLKDLRSMKESDGSNDPVCVWKSLNVQNPLVKLAILILSFVPNSASTEWIFSSMGDIQTKNCIEDEDILRDIQGDVGAESDSSSNEDDWEDLDANSGTDDNDSLPQIRALNMLNGCAIPRMRIYFGQKEPIPIADMFNWSVEAGWDEVWIPAIRNY